MINPHDLAELLDRNGFYIDDDDGEVLPSLDPDDNVEEDLLIMLAAVGCLVLKRHADDNMIGFYLPHWKAYSDMDEYCLEFPNDPACKDYDS